MNCMVDGSGNQQIFKEQESAGVEGSRISRGFGKWHKDRGTSEMILTVLNCEGLLEFNLHAAVLYCVVIHSCVTILHCVGISSCVATNKVHTHTQKNTCVVRECVHKIASREGRASSIKTLGTG